MTSYTPAFTDTNKKQWRKQKSNNTEMFIFTNYIRVSFVITTNVDWNIIAGKNTIRPGSEVLEKDGAQKTSNHNYSFFLLFPNYPDRYSCIHCT